MLLTFNFFSFTSIHEAFVYYKYYRERRYGNILGFTLFHGNIIICARGTSYDIMLYIYRQVRSQFRLKLIYSSLVNIDVLQTLLYDAAMAHSPVKIYKYGLEIEYNVILLCR